MTMDAVDGNNIILPPSLFSAEIVGTPGKPNVRSFIQAYAIHFLTDTLLG